MNQKQLLEKLNSARQLIDECIEALPEATIRSGNARGHKDTRKANKVRRTEINFGLNERNFIKNYAKGLSGPKKFVLLLSLATKGKAGVDVDLKNIQAKWKKMTSRSLLGYKFNLYYPNEAKTQGWVDSKKNGVYSLRKNWQDIFS